MNLTKDVFALISGNQFAFCDSSETECQTLQILEKGFFSF